MNKIKAISQYIKDYWSNEDIIQAWNVYCNDKNMDDYVYGNDEWFFEEMFEKADDAVRAVCYGNYEYQDEYVVFNGYGNLDTFDDWEDEKSPIDLDILVNYLIKNGDADCQEEVDRYELIEYFAIDYAEEVGCNAGDVEIIVKEYLEEEDFDFLADDWEDLAAIVRSRLD